LIVAIANGKLVYIYHIFNVSVFFGENSTVDSM